MILVMMHFHAGNGFETRFVVKVDDLLSKNPSTLHQSEMLTEKVEIIVIFVISWNAIN